MFRVGGPAPGADGLVRDDGGQLFRMTDANVPEDPDAERPDPGVDEDAPGRSVDADRQDSEPAVEPNEPA
jgi:hypothetical protein